MAHQAFGQRLRQPQAFPSKRQVGQTVLTAGVLARRRQHLETAVEQERVQVDTGWVDGVRQRDLADRLAVSGPQGLKGAKHGPEADIRVRPGAIKRRHVLRGQAGFQAVNGQLFPAAAYPGCGGHPGLRVQGPGVFRFAFAENLDPAAAAVVGSAQYRLNPPPGFVARLFLGEYHRAVQLQIRYVNRSGALAERHGRGHDAVHGSRHDDTSENPVVVQPGGVGGEYLGFEQHLAARRLVAGTQQRVAGTGPLAPRCLNPVALALKRIARQPDAATLFAGKQTRKGD